MPIIYEREGDEFRVNTTTFNTQRLASVAALQDGGYVIAWQSIQDGDQYGIYVQRYSASGIAQGGETLVNTTTVN